MRRRNDERLEAKLFRKLPNSSEFKKNGIPFKCKLLDKENSTYANLGSVHYSGRSLTIYSTICPDVRGGDRIKVQGRNYLVAGIQYDREALGHLNSSRFSDEYLDSICPKVISLI